ncbi:MAG: hypothetical protein JKY31_05055 [Rhodobacteraceae bacterium]|nr:hypothetical protein [Paracoccaceae bacterium]
MVTPEINPNNDLVRFDGLGQIYMFHFNGFMRERALIKIDPANVSEFLFTATVFKLNDWVPEVRRAAARLLAKMAKNNDCTKFTKAINYLSGQTLSWKRWHDVKDVYLSFQHSPQVMAILAGELCAAKNGAQSRKFRNLLRDSSIDEHLHKLALQAKLPAVRTIALSTLLEGQARWVTGKQRQWIDKRYNIYRMEKSWRSREITCVANIEAILKITATDKTVTVRKIAADFLITHQETASNVPEIISILENDKYLSIRKRIDFIIQKRRAL